MTTPKDPERMIVFTTRDDESYQVKAKYQSVIEATTKAILKHYEQLSATS